MGAGRPSDLTEEVFEKIKEGILDGLDYAETAKYSGIEIGTFYAWTYKNYCNLSDKIEVWKHERMLRLAEITSNKIQTLPINGEDGKVDKELLKIKQKEAEFIRETLGKIHYSKRSELTGKDGEAIKTENITSEEVEKLLELTYGIKPRSEASDSSENL